MKKIIFILIFLLLFTSFAKGDITLAYFYTDKCPGCEEIKPFIEELENISYVKIEKYYVGLAPSRKNENDSILYNLSVAYESIYMVPIIFMANEWYFFGDEDTFEKEKQRLLDDIEELKDYNISSPIAGKELIYPKPICILILYNSSKNESILSLKNDLEKNIKFVKVEEVDLAFKENQSIAKRLGVEETPVVFIGENKYSLNEYNVSFIINEAKKYEKIGISFPKNYEEKKICLVFFYSPGCEACRKFKIKLEALARIYPLEIKEYDVHKDKELLLDYYEKYNVSRIRSVNVFIGDKFFYSESQLDEIEEEIKKWLSTGLDCPCPGKANAEEFLKKYTLLAVIIGGLLDGINPCAIATLIFFIAYLERVKRKEAIIPIGISFSLAIYICYFLIGIGLLEFLLIIEEEISFIAIYIHGTIGVAAIIFGLFSLYDFISIKRGKRIILQMPFVLKKKRGRIIRKITEDKGIILLSLVAFIAGLLISPLELVCTGQILIVILEVIKNSTSSRLLAILYLIIYNFMFILPLLLILSLFYIGYSSKTMADMQKRSYAYTKLIIGLFLLILGIYLTKLAFL